MITLINKNNRNIRITVDYIEDTDVYHAAYSERYDRNTLNGQVRVKREATYSSVKHALHGISLSDYVIKEFNPTRKYKFLGGDKYEAAFNGKRYSITDADGEHQRLFGSIATFEHMQLITAEIQEWVELYNELKGVYHGV